MSFFIDVQIYYIIVSYIEAFSRVVDVSTQELKHLSRCDFFYDEIKSVLRQHQKVL